MTVGAEKVHVEFIDDKHEGARKWVPRSRLETEWNRLDEYVDREAREAAVFARRASKAEVRAYLIVLSVMPKELVEVGTLDWGECIILDLDGLGCFLKVGPRGVVGDDPTYQGRDGLIVGPATTNRIVQLAAPLLAALVHDAITDEERVARRRAAVGHEIEGVDGDLIYVPAEKAARYFAREISPAHALVRKWIGAEESTRADEIEVLRAQLAHTAKLAHYAIRDLEALRSNTSAARHRKELSDPTEEWFGHGLTGDELAAARQRLYPYRWREDCNCTFGTPGRPPHRANGCMQLELRARGEAAGDRGARES